MCNNNASAVLTKVQPVLLAAKKEEKRPLLVDRMEAKEDATREAAADFEVRGGEGEQGGDEGGAGDQLLESIIHRNIKLENILLYETHSKAAIADFGLSNFWDPTRDWGLAVALPR